MVYYDQNLHMYAWQHCLTTGMCNITFLMDEAMLSISPASRGQLVKMLITLEPPSIFGSTFAYLFILTLSIHWYRKTVAWPRLR